MEKVLAIYYEITSPNLLQRGIVFFVFSETGTAFAIASATHSHGNDKCV
jgi:hypothetical protein